MQKACHRQLLLHPLPLKTKWLIHENDLKPVLDPAESCHQNLCTDTVITLTVKAASILYTRSINAKSLCIDRPCLISCTAHGIFLCLYYLVHSDDQKYILRAECISLINTPSSLIAFTLPRNQSDVNAFNAISWRSSTVAALSLS